MIVELLAVVLRGQETHVTGSNILGIWDLEDMPNPLVVQDGPANGSSTGGAVGAIETLDADVGLGGRANEIVKAVGNACSSSPVNQNIK